MPTQFSLRMGDTSADEDVVTGTGNLLATGRTVLVYFNDDAPRCDAVAAFDRCREVARKLIGERGA